MQVDAPQWPWQASQPVCRALICATTVYRKAKCTTPQAAMVRQSCKHGL